MREYSTWGNEAKIPVRFHVCLVDFRRLTGFQHWKPNVNLSMYSRVSIFSFFFSYLAVIVACVNFHLYLGTDY